MRVHILCVFAVFTRLRLFFANLVGSSYSLRVPFRVASKPSRRNRSSRRVSPVPRMQRSLMRRSLLLALAVGSHAEFDACGRPAGSWLGIDQVCCTLLSCAASIHASTAEALGNRARAQAWARSRSRDPLHMRCTSALHTRTALRTHRPRAAHALHMLQTRWPCARCPWTGTWTWTWTWTWAQAH